MRGVHTGRGPGRRQPSPAPRHDGGSVAHGDPASDLPTALLALDATFVLQDPEVPARFRRTTSSGDSSSHARARRAAHRDPGPQDRGQSGFAFEKFNRRAQDWAIIGPVATRVNGGTHVALVNMGSTLLRATAVETALGQGASAADAAREASGRNRPARRPQRVTEYRAHLAQVLVRRARSRRSEPANSPRLCSPRVTACASGAMRPRR